MTKIQEDIKKLCAEKDAVIMAHYYTNPEIQEIADFVGDSFYLAKVAKQDKHKTIVFCGVTFMGESACIIAPNKNILIPDESAVCPMALMVSKDKIQMLRNKYSDLSVVCYINSSAEIKALADVCVTSSNAVKIVKSLPCKNIFFIPDYNLGSFIKEIVPEKNIILNDGFCHVHADISADELKKLKAEHPHAVVMTHPECKKEVCDMSDFLGSTKEIIEYASKVSDEEFIICTEKGVLYELEKKAPSKRFYFVGTEPICPGMKKITLEKVYDCLLNENPKASVDKNLAEKASLPLERMLELASK